MSWVGWVGHGVGLHHWNMVIWWVVWLPWILNFPIYWECSSQLTDPIFQRGGLSTNQCFHPGKWRVYHRKNIAMFELQAIGFNQHLDGATLVVEASKTDGNTNGDTHSFQRLEDCFPWTVGVYVGEIQPAKKTTGWQHIWLIGHGLRSVCSFFLRLGSGKTDSCKLPTLCDDGSCIAILDHLVGQRQCCGLQ